jgi:CBS domain-containing protein
VEPLIVHRRRVIGPDGQEQVEEVVACPAERGSVDIRRCQQCGHGSSPVYDEAMGCVVVDCARAARPPASVENDRGVCAPRTTSIATLFTRDVICAEAETPAARMTVAVHEAEVGAFPVVDRARMPIGIVEVRQLLAAPPDAVVSDVMTPRPLRVRDEVSVARAAAMMAHNRVHHLVVIGEDGKLLGILSSLDICRYLSEESGAIVPRTSVSKRPSLDFGK